MPAKPDFTISVALICDDYRREDNGKGLLVGLYGPKIGFIKKPETFSFCICLFGKARKTFSLEIKAEFIPDTEGQKSEVLIGADIGRIDPDTDAPSPLFVATKGVTLALNGEGKLLVKIRGKGAKRWKTISETKVEVNPTPFPLRQPS
jgi:hypothetical protein